MTAPAAVRELVERFDAHRETYQSGQYNEAQLREEFLNPLFEALGWDVYNRKGYADAYKEVIHEDAIRIGGRTKAPDYCFRAGGGVRSLFVEAKKPSVDIGEAVSPAFQLRRYAWSAKLPVSILTDFEEFAVYDCRIRAGEDRQGVDRAGHLPQVHRVRRSLGRACRAVLARGDPPRLAGDGSSPARRSRRGRPRSMRRSWRKSNRGATIWPGTSPCGTPASRSAT